MMPRLNIYKVLGLNIYSILRQYISKILRLKMLIRFWDSIYKDLIFVRLCNLILIMFWDLNIYKDLIFIRF